MQLWRSSTSLRVSTQHIKSLLICRHPSLFCILADTGRVVHSSVGTWGGTNASPLEWWTHRAPARLLFRFGLFLPLLVQPEKGSFRQCVAPSPPLPQLAPPRSLWSGAVGQVRAGSQQSGFRLLGSLKGFSFRQALLVEKPLTAKC